MDDGKVLPLELTILMPCLNEAETLATCIRKARGFLERSGIAGEVVIADNGSTDGSQAIAEGLGARVVPIPERGYGAALIGGIRAARGRYVIMGDSDDSYDFSRLDNFVAKLREGWQLVMGNRFKGGIEPGAMPPLHKYLGNPVLTATGRILYGSPSGDFHCGLRGFDRDAILGLGLNLPGMEFASEMVVKATIQKLRITEVPTTLSKDGRSRPPHLRSWRDGWRHLRFLLLFSPRWVFLYTGAVMFALGLIGVLALETGPVHLFGATLDIHSLLYASLLVVLGYQSVLFWVFCKTLNMTQGMLAPDPAFERLHDVLTLERSLLFALALLLVGLGLGVAATLGWGRTGFGTLSPEHTMRLAIPSATLILLAVSTASMAFFLSFLRLVRRSE
ncbi:MAG TPA: glycosyltransferase family 2 protein [Acetobacteraceae bacterium]|nr:glycosyltransferase family 2 protein [Acetobacteraceae bacterium]